MNIPYSVRDKNTRINAIPGMNFDNITTNALIKKVDDNNAGNSNIQNYFTANGSVTSLINDDPNDVLSIVGGVIETSVVGGNKKMEVSVGTDGSKRSIILQENQPIVIEDDLSLVNLDVDGLIKLGGSSGTDGAVLTSNGTSDPTWLEKINLFAYKTVDTTGIAYNVDTVVVGYTTTVESNGSSFDTATGEFTSPRTGLYKVETFITIKDGSVPNIATGDVFINVYSGGSWSRFKTVILSMNNTETEGITLQNSAIIQLALNDKIRVSAAVRTGGGGTSDILASVGALNKLTTLAIHSID